jgi:uncharacterized glyoxalase superfamily protein PhnB
MSDTPALLHNRSMPACSVIPVLAYADVPQAVAWLCRAFGLRERLRIGTHRVQLSFGDGAVVVTGPAETVATAGVSLMLRVADVDAHYQHALAAGAQVSGEPVSFPQAGRMHLHPSVF